MYTDELFSAILLLTLSTTAFLNIQAQQTYIPLQLPQVTPLTGNYPPLDTPPPPVDSWNALVDQLTLPNASVKAVGGACAPVDTFCDWSCTECLRPESDFSFCPDEGDWALTYDDGPTNNTLTVLNALNAKGIKATFFVIGSRVYQNPQILKLIVDSGHQIGVHTWSHTALTTQTTEEIIAEVKWTEMAIQQAVGLTPKWFRAPLGDCDDRVRGILTQLGYQLAFWDRDTSDWESNKDPNFDLNWITQNFTIWVQNKTSSTGFASLEHDAFTLSSSKAPAALDIVLNANFNPQSVSVCTGDRPYVENVTLPRSNINVAVNTTTINNTPATSSTGTSITSTVIVAATTSTSASTGPASSSTIKKSGTISIEKNVLLSIMCGLTMMSLGFVGIV